MRAPRKALILAAGFGTRLAPLSLQKPKCLVPFWEQPMLDRALDLLHAWKVRDVVVNLHHGAAEVAAHLLRRNGPPRLHLSFEPDILGTGGALRRAQWFFDDAPFWIINADVVSVVDPAPLLRRLAKNDVAAALWMTKQAGPRTVEVRNGLVRNFASATPGAPGTLTFTGLQLVAPSILRHLPPRAFFSLVDVYEAARTAGLDIAGVDIPGSYWADIGSPESYVAAHGDAWTAALRGEPWAQVLVPAALRRKRARLVASGVAVDGFVAASAGVTIAPGARIRNGILWEDARISRRGAVEDGIVGRGTPITGPVRRMALRASDCGDAATATACRKLDWPPAATSVEYLSPRGSAREFRRLRHGPRSAILCVYSLERPENARFAGHARFLRRNGIPVPRILVDDPAQTFFVMEDAGDRPLQDEVTGRSHARIMRLYSAVIPHVAALHARATRAAIRDGISLEAPFTRTLFSWEHELFIKYMLTARHGAGPATLRAWRLQLARVSALLERLPAVLLHRDLQSSNILLQRGRPVFIDFQGMRLGPATYDLASLLCDPYVSLPEPLQLQLLDLYLRTMDRPDPALAATFWPASVQRLAQALGAFGRLGSRTATSGFSRHIRPALRMLDRASRHLDNGAQLSELVRDLLSLEEKRSPA